MADKKFNLQFEATLEIGKMKTALDQINKSLTQTSVNLPKGISSTLDKTIQSIRTEMMKLEGLDGIELSPQAAKDVSKTYNSLLKNFQNLKVIMGDIGREFNIDPQRFFPKELSENIDNATKALNKYNNALNKGPQTEEYKALVEDLKKANRALEEYNDKASKAETKGKIATTRKDELQKELNIQKAISEEAEQAVKSAQDQIDMAQAQARTLKQIEALERKIAEAENRRAKAQAKSDQKAEQMSSKKRTDTKVYAELESSKTKADAEVAAETTLIERYRQEIQAATESAQKIQIAEEQKTQALERAANARKEVKKAEKGISSQEGTIKQAAAEFTTYSLEAQKAEASVTELAEKQKKANEAFQTSALKVLVNELNQLGIKVPEVSQNLPSIQKIINNLSSEPIQQITQALEKAGVDAEELGIDLSQVGNKSQEFVELSEAQKRSADEMQRLKSQILDFFSVTNAIQLFKRTVQSALNTVKELDAVMTETAVVTDFSVGDMWERLPEYSAEATKLGASIKDLYAATTLYYQQGLQTEAAMGVGIETMKMARIAGMEAAGATEAMTAALRGFNMEVNEANAVRVNDVYSELAAITAADTAQIATAMSKTASIAASANMEFETTAALLAQIIETTQEAPETAGTAMKTIIARFAEVKKLREEGQETGEDEEGQEIDVNKIQGALRKVGISMDEFFSGTEGLDSILLKLAEKWGTLDFETQRYIATTAAGSRQQSRFIAMMSDYERTMELATAANNSAGASQLQFDKTLDSMEAKLQKLKNAWDQFAMGLADNEILKGAVDLLTNTLEAVNKLTEALSGGNGLVKSIVSLMAVVGALKGGAALLGKGASSFGEKIGLPLKRKEEKGNKVKQSETNKNSEKEHYAQGQRDGQAYSQGKNSAIQSELSKQTFIGKVTIDSDDLLNQIETDFLKTPIDLPLSDQLAQLHQDLEEGKISAEEAKKAFEGLGGDTEKIKKLELNLQNIGVASMAAGGALSLLSSYFDKIGNTKAANALSTLSTVFMGLGSTLTTLTTLFPGLAKAVTISGGQISIAGLGVQAAWWQVTLVITALVGVAYLLAKAFKNVQAASPEGQFKAAKEAAEEAAGAANEAAEAYDNLKSSFESLEGKEISLENLTIGTQEWKDAVQELNNQILDLIELYPELAEFVSYNDSGILTISEKGKNLALDKHLQRQRNTQAAKIGANINELRAQQNLDYSELDSNLKIVIEEKIESPNYKNNNTISSEFIKRQEEILDSQTPHYGSESAFIGQDTEKKYDKAETEALARAIASGDWKGREGQIATITGTSDPKEFVNTEEYKDLRNFGQALIESDAAIKIFTDSLENAAILNADVSEEYKNSLSGIYDTEATEKMMAAEKEKIDLSTAKSREEWEGKYADAMGYQYEDGKFYSGEGENKKEVTVLDQDIKSQLAAINVQKKMTENLAQASKTLNTLSTSSIKLGETFVNMSSKAEGAGLTLSDLGKLKGSLNEDLIIRDEEGKITQWSEGLAELYTEVGYLYSSPEEFYRVILETYTQAEQSKQQTSEKFESMNLGRLEEGELFSDVDVDVNSLQEIADDLYQVFITSGEQATLEVAESIDGILKTLSPKDAQIFAEALTKIDWSNTDDVETFEKLLKDLGFEGAISDMQDFKKELIAAAKATKKINLEETREKIKTNQDLLKDIREREENERTFDQESYDTLINANPELANDLIMTAEGEFTFVGDSMDSLILALNNNTNNLIDNTGALLGEKAAQSQKWIDAQDNIVNTQVQNGQVQNTSFSDAMNTLQNGGNFDNQTLINMLKLIGADTSGTNQVMTDRLKTLNNQYYGFNGQIANENIAENGKWWQQEQASKIANTNNLQIQTDLQKNKLTQDVEVIGGKRQETVQLDEKETNAHINGLKAQATQIGVNINKIKEFDKALEKNKGQLTTNTAAILTNAIQDEKATQSLTKTLTAVGKVVDKYEDMKDMSEEDIQTIGEAFGLEDLTKDSKNFNFIKDNLNLINDGLNGDIEKLQQFQGLLAQQMGVKINAETGFIDLSGLINAEKDVTQAALEALNALVKSGAYEIETVTVKTSGDYDVPIIENGIITGFEKKYYDQGQTYQVVKPIDAPQIRDAGGRAGRPAAPKAPKKKKGGGGGSKKEKWENPYDKYYNLVQKINAELRKREKLERRYQELLARTGTTATQLQENTKKEVAAVKKEMDYREQLLAKRKQEMKSLEKSNKKYEKYAYYDEKTSEVVINWSEINKIKDADLGGKVEKYISKLEGKEEEIKSEEDALDEQTEILRAIYDRGKDEYFDLESQIKDALINERQQEIDKLSAINDSINDTNSRLIDAMQSSIDKYRQDRENERTEEELSDKQRRLAYLQQDTSGANALEIMQLQEEIDQGMEDYTDQLIDQKINELQEQNDKAAEQREKQIAIAEAQLKKWEESGEIWDKVYKLMDGGLQNGKIKSGSELAKLLKEGSNFESMSELGKMQWQEDIENLAAAAINWIRSGNSIQAQLDTGKIKAGKQISFTTKDGETVKGTVQKNGTVKTSGGQTYKGVYQNYDGSYLTDESYIAPKKTTSTTKKAETKTTSTQTKTIEVGGKINAKGAKIYGYIGGKGETQYFANDPIYKVLDEKDGYLKVRHHKVSNGVTGWFKKKDVKAYKTGGLADFTGPAWLDGTKSKPEYILNAEQTKSFFELVDVLGSLKSGTNQSSQITGDSIYDVDINVESIGSDYDVEQLATTIKRMINDDARYRNNNAINLQR